MIVGSNSFCPILRTFILSNTPLLALNESSNQVIICWITRIVSGLLEVPHLWQYAPPWWPPSVLLVGTGRTGRTSPSGRKAPSGKTGRTYPSGIASPDEPAGSASLPSAVMPKNSFAIVANHHVFKQLVVRNFVLSIKSDSSETHIEPPLPTLFCLWTLKRTHQPFVSWRSFT